MSLRRVLTEYLRHYNTSRLHRSLGQLAPAQAHTRPPQINLAEHRIRRQQVLSGLTSEYQIAASQAPRCCEKTQVTTTIVYSSPTRCRGRPDGRPDTLADLAERLTSMPVEAAAAEDAAGSATWHSPGRRRRLLIAIPAVAALAVTALLVTSLGVVTFSPGSRVTGSGPASAGPARHTGGVRNPVAAWGNLYPLGPPGLTGAEKTTVAGAQAAVGYPVPVPSTAAASRANLTQVWVNLPIGHQVALVFDKGKVEILMHRGTYRSGLHYFHAFIAEKNKNGGVTAEIGQVNGRPALVIWPVTNYSHSNPAVVIFW